MGTFVTGYTAVATTLLALGVDKPTWKLYNVLSAVSNILKKWILVPLDRAPQITVVV